MPSKKEYLVYIDGELVKESEAKISVFDHGFLYGDGVFEGIRAYRGVVFKLDEHLDRLYNSAKGIALEIPMKKEDLKKAVLNTLRVNKLTDAYIRLIITRGIGPLGIDPKTCKRPTVIIITRDIQLYPREVYDRGMKVVTASTRRIPPQCLSSNIKSLNYLNNILAKLEGHNAGVPEVIMLDINGFVAECSADNIFIVKDGKIYTPTIKNCLPGITRSTVIEIARELGYEVYEENITLQEVYTADEVFLTGTAAEIAPIVEVDGRKIGDGKPGPITKKLAEEFKIVREREGTPI